MGLLDHGMAHESERKSPPAENNAEVKLKIKESKENVARAARHAVGRSNRAALKDLFSASCFPILIRLRRSRLGSGGFGIWATMRAMSDENASDTCHGGVGGRSLHWHVASRFKSGQHRPHCPDFPSGF